MTALAFDTLKAAKALRDAGFEQAQAEAVAATVGGALTGDVATKGDIKELRSDMEGMEARMNERMAEQFRDLYKHLWLMGVGIVGAAVALIKFL